MRGGEDSAGSDVNEDRWELESKECRYVEERLIRICVGCGCAGLVYFDQSIRGARWAT